jgi:hypothetical protein
MTQDEIKNEVAIERLIVIEAEITDFIESRMDLTEVEEALAGAIVEVTRFVRQQAQSKVSKPNG